MNERNGNISLALSWLIGVIALGSFLPHVKLGLNISHYFLETQWMKSVVEIFTKNQESVKWWTEHAQWAIFTLLIVGFVSLLWRISWKFYIARRDEESTKEAPAILLDRISTGLIWAVSTTLSFTLFCSLWARAKKGTLSSFLFDLAKGQFESKILLGFLLIAGLVAFVLMISRNIRTIFFKELRIYFTTPIAYVVMMLFSLLSGYFFAAYFDFFHRYSSSQMMRMRQMANFNFNDFVFSRIFGTLAMILLFLVPILTMRLISEEKRNRTFELLMTSPLNTIEIVLGKYLSALMALAVLLSVTLYYPWILGVVSPGSLEWAPLFTAYLGLFLTAASFAAIGLLCSSFTENQIIAAVSAFGTLLLLYIIELLAHNMSDGILRSIVEYLSVLSHLKGFLKGVVDVKDVVYYLSLIFFANFLTHRIVESHRWR